MPPALGLIALLLAAALAGLVTRPAGPSSRRRHRERRLRVVQRNPQLVNDGDLAYALSLTLPVDRLQQVGRWRTERSVPTLVLWQWMHRHGGEMLWLVLAAGFTRDDLVARLDDAHTLDRRSLELLAELSCLNTATRAPLVTGLELDTDPGTSTWR